MSQNDAILSDLRKGKRVTPLSAFHDHNCLRLSGRIYDLKRKGYAIGKEMVNDRLNNRRYARYWLAKGRAA